MRRRVRGSGGAKWWWGPHISSPWPKGGENENDRVNILTVYGIETSIIAMLKMLTQLQQYLPFTVLKLTHIILPPLTTLCCNSTYRLRYWNVSTNTLFSHRTPLYGCTSTYRLWYWNYLGKTKKDLLLPLLQQYLSLTVYDKKLNNNLIGIPY